ncbi:hypothetical protein L484_015718 [Morus notabilis]|uniref:Transmembrane protein n=1 Tax=Morus notabilis TaxID=981085 RepID=W9S8G7_9ROSA|nr:hypothetical protein L484_015718 [Morus notabilis]
MAETSITTSPQPQQPVLNFTNVLSESRQLIKSQPCHFLSILASTVYPLLRVHFSYSVVSQNNFLNQTTNSTNLVPDHDQRNQPANIVLINALLLILSFFLFHLVLLACTVGSITYTAFHGLHRQPIKPKSIIKSLSTSFFPLLATTLLVDAIIFAISIIFAVSLVLMIIIALLLWFPIDASSSYFTAIGVMMILFAAVAIYLQVNWALASVVVVTESTSGFEALKWSQTLIKGRRSLVLSIHDGEKFGYVRLPADIHHEKVANDGVV